VIFVGPLFVHKTLGYNSVLNNWGIQFFLQWLASFKSLQGPAWQAVLAYYSYGRFPILLGAVAIEYLPTTDAGCRLVTLRHDGGPISRLVFRFCVQYSVWVVPLLSPAACCMGLPTLFWPARCCSSPTCTTGMAGCPHCRSWKRCGWRTLFGLARGSCSFSFCGGAWPRAL